MKSLFILCFAIAWFGALSGRAQPGSADTSASRLSERKKYRVDIGGAIQVHYLEEFNTNGDIVRDPGGFRILRARLTAQGKVNRFTSCELMIDPRSPEHEGLLRDAFIAFRLWKHQVLRVGQQKTQFGYENRESVTRLFVVNRAEMSDGLGRGVNLRDIGIGLLGHVPLSEKLRLENAATFTNGSRMNVSGPWEFSNTKNGWGRLGLRYKDKIVLCRWGISAGTGGILELGDSLPDPSDDMFIHFRRMGTDVQADHKYFFLAGEYAFGTNTVADTLEGEPFGYYILIAGKTKWKVGPLGRLDVFEDEYRRVTLGAYYGLPEDKFRILVNYEFRKNILDVPGGHDDRLYIQAQVVF